MNTHVALLTMSCQCIYPKHRRLTLNKTLRKGKNDDVSEDKNIHKTWEHEWNGDTVLKVGDSAERCRLNGTFRIKLTSVFSTSTLCLFELEITAPHRKTCWSTVCHWSPLACPAFPTPLHCVPSHSSSGLPSSPSNPHWSAFCWWLYLRERTENWYNFRLGLNGRASLPSHTKSYVRLSTVPSKLKWEDTWTHKTLV